MILVRITLILIFLSACPAQGFSFQASRPRVKIEFHVAEETPGEGLREVVSPQTKSWVYMYAETIITNKDIVEASAGESAIRRFDGVRQNLVNVTFTREAGERMAKVSEQPGQRKHLVVLLDGKVLSVALIEMPISDKAQLIGGFSKKDAERIARALNNPSSKEKRPPRRSNRQER
jgi:preprotein translocase subunit SecD